MWLERCDVLMCWNTLYLLRSTRPVLSRTLILARGKTCLAGTDIVLVLRLLQSCQETFPQHRGQQTMA